jgi:hypothetical protein
MCSAQKTPRSTAVLPFQEELFDYLEFLLAKAECEDKEWSRLSLASAMRGMEAEPEIYTLADLKVKYS